jgi:hypothetical protein
MVHSLVLQSVDIPLAEPDSVQKCGWRRPAGTSA